jgi:hypothetical protein
MTIDNTVIKKDFERLWNDLEVYTIDYLKADGNICKYIESVNYYLGADGNICKYTEHYGDTNAKDIAFKYFRIGYKKNYITTRSDIFKEITTELNKLSNFSDSVNLSDYLKSDDFERGFYNGFFVGIDRAKDKIKSMRLFK